MSLEAGNQGLVFKGRKLKAEGRVGDGGVDCVQEPQNRIKDPIR